MRKEQPKKQFCPKLVTEFGIVVSLQPVIMALVADSTIALQFSRESYSGLSASTLMVEREEQFLKQFPVILVTEEGIFIERKEEHPKKQSCPKLVTEFGITVSLQPAIMVLVAVSIIALQFSRESYTGFLASTVMAERELQPLKQSPLTLVTEEGISIEIKEEQS